jgi:hypothetical protein
VIGDYQVQIDIGLGEIGRGGFETFRNAHLAREHVKQCREIYKDITHVTYLCYYVKDVQGNTRREYLFGEDE